MVPGLLPIFLHGCEIKVGSGLGTRLGPLYIFETTLSEDVCKHDEYQTDPHTHTHAHMHTHMHAHTHMHTHAHTHMHTHTYTHTHTHTHRAMNAGSRNSLPKPRPGKLNLLASVTPSSQCRSGAWRVMILLLKMQSSCSSLLPWPW